jgi:hypothetical protein
MDISDRLKNLTDKAKDTAAEHKDQIRAAVEKAERSADQKTGGEYHDQIAKAGETVKSYLDKLESPDTGEPHSAAGADAAAETADADGEAPERPPSD